MCESLFSQKSECVFQQMCAIAELNGVVLLSVVRTQMQPANQMVSVFTLYCEIERKETAKVIKIVKQLNNPNPSIVFTYVYVIIKQIEYRGDFKLHQKSEMFANVILPSAVRMSLQMSTVINEGSRLTYENKCSAGNNSNDNPFSYLHKS